MGNGMRGTRGMFTRIPGNLLQDSGECSHISIPGNAREDSGDFIYLFILSLMLTITEQILFTIKNSNKMLIDVNTLVKKPIEHNTFFKK